MIQRKRYQVRIEIESHVKEYISDDQSRKLSHIISPNDTHND